MAVVALLVSLSFLAVSPSIADEEGRFPGQWIWPTGAPVAVLKPFAPPPKPWNAGHRGVDLNVAIGATIVSPAPGIVIYAGKAVDRPVVSVLHSGGLRSTYEPLEPLVTLGQIVEAGTSLGTVSDQVGSGGHLGLHWGARFEKNQYVDPLRMLVGPSILKPWD